MDKNAIKKYAIWARTEMISRVAQRAIQYGIEKDNIVPANAGDIHGRILTPAEKQQRQALIAQINTKGYEQVIEEVAYTWFNRFIALRFMEVNGYLPSMIRVFSNDDNEFKPQILTEAINLDLDGLDMEKVFAMKEADQNEELFKYLLIVQCNALSSSLPVMFQRIEDYTELLLPDNLLREGSVVEQLVTMIPEEDWTDQVQIIGWLYQYYNAQKKDDVFAALKKNVKITKENIPAATQLFTPDWIVRYMVENSLGRLWLEGHPDEDLKSEWRYYLDEAEQEPAVQAQLDAIRAEYRNMDPTEIKVIDPCMGSGHILVYAFDVLMQIYQSAGWSQRDAARNIVQNNLYGLDIDDRAAQLAYFAVMMKGCQYDRRFLKRQLQPNVFAITESGRTDAKGKQEWLVSSDTIDYFADGNESLRKDAIAIREAMFDAKEYGSILTMPKVDFEAMKNRIDELWDEFSMYRDEVINTFWPVLRVAEALAQKYDVVVTNPPYMGASGMSTRLSDYVKKNYPDSKSDLFAVFIEQCGLMTAKNRYQAMITQHAWMFLSSYEKLRSKLLHTDTVNMVHLGPRAFEEIGGEVVQTTSFVMRRSHFANYLGTYCRLIEPTSQQGKEDLFLSGDCRYLAQQSNFSKIPGAPAAYWVSSRFADLFIKKTIRDVATACIGMRTGNNDRFLRLWHEVATNRIGFGYSSAESALIAKAKWIPYNKGGEYRKWYGNHDYVVNWENDGEEIKENTRRVYPQLGDNLGWKISNEKYYFGEGISWTVITSKPCFRRYYPGCIFSNSGQSVIAKDPQKLDYLTGLLNSHISADVLTMISPTLGYESGYVNKIPVIENRATEVVTLVRQNIAYCRNDWDSFENSWDFQRHPLVAAIPKGGPAFEIGNIYLSECYQIWEGECAERFNQLKANEEELNRIFIDIYGLQDELTPEVEDKDVTVRLADLKRDVKSLISYAVGCMFGRYSLDETGLAYAGGEWDGSKYSTFSPARTNIIPICDDDYFEDDITNRFVEWIKTVYGENTLEENLKFIADALGGKGTPRDVIRSYFLNEFYADHVKLYQKRPIYWLFDSGKKGGFRALIYMHRYQPDTIARVRTDYVHELQSRYRTAIEGLEERITGATTSERVRLSKRLKALKEQADEIHTYEEKIHHLADQMISIDLDDGVKKNYEIFKDVLAKIK